MKSLIQYIFTIRKLPLMKQLSWYTGGQVMIQLFSFLGVVVTSRYLGPTNLGLYSFVQNYLGVFMTLTTGMDFYFTWKVAKSENPLNELVTFFWHKLHVTLSLSAIGIAAAWYTLPQDVAMLATIMFAPLLLNSCSSFYLYAITSQKAKMIALVQTGVSALLFITKMTLVFVHAPLVSFVVVTSVDTVLISTMIAVIFMTRKDVRHAFKSVLSPSVWSTFSFMYGIRMSLIAIVLWQFILRVDQLVLATFTNAYTLGIYAAAVKIAEVPNFLAGVLYTALVTHVALFAAKEDAHSKRRIQKVMLTYFISGTLIALGIVLFAPLLVKILYGGKFIEAIPVLRVYALSIPGMFLSLHYFGVYGARDRHFEQSSIFLVGLLINVLLIYILTPLYGLVGAALGTALTYNLLAFIFYTRVR